MSKLAILALALTLGGCANTSLQNGQITIALTPAQQAKVAQIQARLVAACGQALTAELVWAQFSLATNPTAAKITAGVNQFCAAVRR
jgi:hypothetical protein